MVNIRNGDLRRPAEPMKPVVDPAGWTGAELKASDDWVFRLDAGDIAEIDAAAEGVEARGLDIKDISRDDFPLPGLDSKLAQIKTELIDGRGIAVLRGLPVERYDIARSAAAFWGMGLRIGEPVSQNHKGHVLGHVLDLLGDSRDKDPTTRAYNTSSALDYHSDSCDVAVLLCLHKAKSGGESLVASTVAVYNEMLRRRPDLVEELIKPWYRDRRGEIPPGKKPWFELPIFNFPDGHLTTSWASYYIRSAQRFDELPRFTDHQIEALDGFSASAAELSYEMTFEPGDIQFLHNHVAVHARTIYQDHPEADRKRHLLRLWLTTPGGRPLPEGLRDRYAGLKPGQRPHGIMVEGMELSAPLVPE